MITRPQKICDCCNRPVAERIGFCFWKAICSYTTVRSTAITTVLDPVDGIPYTFDAKVDKHYCKGCWNDIIDNINRRYEVMTR